MKKMLGNIEFDTIFENNTWETIRDLANFASENNLHCTKLYKLCGWKHGDKKATKLLNGETVTAFLVVNDSPNYPEETRNSLREGKMVLDWECNLQHVLNEIKAPTYAEYLKEQEGMKYQYGKFETADDLYKAYLSLEKEFTRRSQELAIIRESAVKGLAVQKEMEKLKNENTILKTIIRDCIYKYTSCKDCGCEDTCGKTKKECVDTHYPILYDKAKKKIEEREK